MTDAERNALIVEAMPTIQAAARRFARSRGIRDVSEVEGEAYLIAVKLSRSYDPAKGVPFEVYLNCFICLNLNRSFNAPSLRSLALLGDLDNLPDPAPEMPLDWTLGGLKWIPEGRDREIVKKRLEGRSIREIGREYGISGRAVTLIVRRHYKRWEEAKRK